MRRLTFSVGFPFLVLGAAVVLLPARGLASASQDCVKMSGDDAIRACTEAIRKSPRTGALFYNRGIEKAGGADLQRRDSQRSRYAWLRPLELLWIDRALESGRTNGQLRGRMSVERWRLSKRELPDFAMRPDQLRRYRQIGMYGAYRVVLRNVPGLTIGDGWTLGVTGHKLAQVVNESLPPQVRLKREYFEKGTRWARWVGGSEGQFWVERGWRNWHLDAGGYLPTTNDAVTKPLSADERRLLEPALFDDNSVRRVAAQALNGARGAASHVELCVTLANSDALRRMPGFDSLAHLPAFSRFADAAMHAMRGVWDEINGDLTDQSPTSEKLARSVKLQSRFDLVRKAGSIWLQSSGTASLPQYVAVTKLAEAMRDAATPLNQLRALERHHQQFGGGRLWFHERSGRMVPLVADTGIAAADYRFRLRTLCCLAAQCGVAKMDGVLKIIATNELAGIAAEDRDEDSDIL